jgi:hypothetical protein
MLLSIVYERIIVESPSEPFGICGPSWSIKEAIGQ